MRADFAGRVSCDSSVFGVSAVVAPTATAAIYGVADAPAGAAVSVGLALPTGGKGERAQCEPECSDLATGMHAPNCSQALLLLEAAAFESFDASGISPR